MFEPLMNAHIPIGTACRGDQICGKCVFQAEPKSTFHPKTIPNETVISKRRAVRLQIGLFATISDDITLTYPSGFPMASHRPHSET